MISVSVMRPGSARLARFRLRADESAEELPNGGPGRDGADDDDLGELGERHADLRQQAGLGGGDRRAAGDQADQPIFSDLVARAEISILVAWSKFAAGDQ